MSKIIEKLKDKKIIILGFGMEGQSTYKYIRKYLPDKELVIMDNNYQNISLNDRYASLVDVDYNSINTCDIIIKAPGVSFKDIDITPFASKISSQLQLFLETTESYTIGVTGTKGKSTTSSLMYKVLCDQGKKAFLVGNIGKPILDIADEADKDSYTVIEMSCHQLQYTTHSPRLGIILNLFEEHLDHYRNKEEYFMAKINGVNYDENEYFLYTSDNELLNYYKDFARTSGQFINITDTKKENSYTYKDDQYVYVNGEPVFAVNSERKIVGTHNLKNIMFVLTASKLLNLNLAKTVESVCSFEPLPHRIELVGTYEGVTYYNDSIATIPDAAINAVEALKNVNTIIIGGMDRGIDYTPLVDYLKQSNIENIICLPTTGHKIAGLLGSLKKTYLVQNVEEAVDKARVVTQKGMICLMSPAAPSYGFYKNFEERGDRYKEHIRKIGSN